jgi:putative Mg2+ transporter-C (MgtC) family protein
METLLREITSSTPSAEQAIRVLIRLFAATRLAGIVGYERQTRGKSAGLRTRMLVAIGSAMFVLAPLEAGMAIADVSRVVQGVAAGIGFIGAGAILKLKSEKEIQGLTTAAGVWMTAAIGLAAGMGRLGLAAQRRICVDRPRDSRASGGGRMNRQVTSPAANVRSRPLGGWSGRLDLNQRPLGPEPSALPS